VIEAGNVGLQTLNMSRNNQVSASSVRAFFPMRRTLRTLRTLRTHTRARRCGCAHRHEVAEPSVRKWSVSAMPRAALPKATSAMETQNPTVAGCVAPARFWQAAEAFPRTEQDP
jgi:hypothetical protein